MAETKFDLKKKRIREFFSTFKPGSRHRGKEIDEIQEEAFKEGMIYVQMRLPVEKITEEFENSLKEKIERSFMHAKIRVATKQDLKIVMAMYNKAWLTANTPFRPIEIDSLKTIFKDPDTVFLIARVYGIDGGFVILDFEGDNKEYAIIAGLGVLPRFQRKGLGTVLGMAAWNHIKEHHPNVKELRCEVYKDNSISYRFIKWIGFEEFGKKLYRKEDFLIEEEIE
ncbi:MAG: GNAT family N-acetyltransferase [Promethearchaeota archaeon]|nr:MAG: GNAT family N-acetyltransferase [Candidatus Lokiarchaeota archaeon]